MPFVRLWSEAGMRYRLELLVFLSAAYVFGCAFRAILPRADVQRICLFDTWLSSVFLGRSVATVAEICFVTQWALVLRHLAGTAESITTRNIANAIIPLIVLAECCSWYAVIGSDDEMAGGAKRRERNKRQQHCVKPGDDRRARDPGIAEHLRDVHRRERDPRQGVAHRPAAAERPKALKKP
jgi:hypothetical protein